MRSHPFALNCPPPPHFLLVRRFDQLPESVMEQDICSFVIGIDERMGQSVLDDRVVSPLVSVEQDQPTTISDRSLTKDPGVHTLEVQTGGRFRAPSTGSAPPHGTATRPSSRMPKDTLGEMLRVRDHVAR